MRLGKCRRDTTTQRLANPKLSFFMPSGEEVSFCSHAAMGAVYSIVKADETRAASKHFVNFDTSALADQMATVDQDDTVGLHMSTDFDESPIDDKLVIEDLLSMLQLDESVLSTKWPSLAIQQCRGRARKDFTGDYLS